MIFCQFNLYIWDISADDMNSSLVSFLLEPCRPLPSNSTRRRRQTMDIISRRKRFTQPDNLFEADEPFGMETNMKVDADMIFMNATPVDKFSMLYNVFNMSDPIQAVIIKVIPPSNESLNVFAKLEMNPSPEDYDWYKTVPGNESGGTGDPTLDYTLLLPAKNLTNGTVYVGVQLDRCIEGLECVDTGDLMQYYISIQNGGCRVWDDENEKWIFDVCQVLKCFLLLRICYVYM